MSEGKRLKKDVEINHNFLNPRDNMISSSILKSWKLLIHTGDNINQYQPLYPYPTGFFYEISSPTGRHSDKISSSRPRNSTENPPKPALSARPPQDPDPSGGNALDIRFLLKPGAASGAWRPEVPLLCASSSGRAPGQQGRHQKGWV